MPTSEKLLPCPFCGGEAEIERLGDRRQSTQYSCTECGCFLETGEEWGHGTEWNRRAALATTEAERDTAHNDALEMAAEALNPYCEATGSHFVTARRVVLDLKT